MKSVRSREEVEGEVFVAMGELPREEVGAAGIIAI
jgi:hypothetical protein